MLGRVATSEGPTLQATVLLSTTGQAPAGTLSMAEQAKVGGPTLRCAALCIPVNPPKAHKMAGAAALGL